MTDIMNNLRDKAEAQAFDTLVLNEYQEAQDKDLFFSGRVLERYLNVVAPPIQCYPYALYLFGDSEIKGKDVLLIACGTGEESIILAKKGANISAFDISPESVEVARKRAALNNPSTKISTEVMSVYNLRYPNVKFGYIFGNACLHHFSLEEALKEICRVMQPGGTTVFREPFSGSKILRKLRDIIPVKKDKISPDERQLTYEDIEVIKRHFKEVSIKEFGLFSRLDRLIKNNKIRMAIYRTDDYLLKNFSFLRKYARRIVIKAIK